MSDYSKAQEYRLERVFKKAGFEAKRVPLSGANPLLGKGDVKVDNGRLLIDHKSTRGTKTISLQKKYIDKIRKDAGEGNLGVITFSFFNDRQLYVAMSLEDFISLYKGEPVEVDGVS